MQLFTIRWHRMLRRPVLPPRVQVALMGFAVTAAVVAGSAAQRWN